VRLVYRRPGQVASRKLAEAAWVQRGEREVLPLHFPTSNRPELKGDNVLGLHNGNHASMEASAQFPGWFGAQHAHLAGPNLPSHYPMPLPPSGVDARKANLCFLLRFREIHEPHCLREVQLFLPTMILHEPLSTSLCRRHLFSTYARHVRRQRLDGYCKSRTSSRVEDMGIKSLSFQLRIRDPLRLMVKLWSCRANASSGLSATIVGLLGLPAQFHLR
jgi:hypothetical protein